MIMSFQNISRKYLTIFFSIILVIGILRGLFLIVHSNSHLDVDVKIKQLSVRSGYNSLGLKFHYNYRSRSSSNYNQSLSMNDDDGNEAVHLMFVFFLTSHNNQLERNLQGCMSSLFKNAESVHLIIIHIFGDQGSFLIVQRILGEIKVRKDLMVQAVHYGLDDIPMPIKKLMKNINDDIGRTQHRFSHTYFYLSLFMHKLLPTSITRLIILDADIVINSDIKKLYALFNGFADANIIGIARENQPVYHYMFFEYRQANPKTRVGAPPPDGLTGFNSGVVLLDLKKMRESVEYNSFLSSRALASMSAKYKFQGHLGDQDVFTLMSLEYEQFFYTLPCGWNRQLCRWWQKADFENVFNDYFLCNEEIHIVHGNCNTEVKVESQGMK